MINPFYAFSTWLAKSERLIGAGLLRASFGFIVFSLAALHIRDRAFIWGPSGIVPLTDFFRYFGYQKTGLNIFAISSSPLVFNTIFFSGLVVCALFTVGLFTRVVTIPFVLFTLSLYHRDPWVTNGGTRLLCIVLLYLIAADLGARFSLDRAFGFREREPGWLSSMLHNTAMLLTIFQVCLVYVFSTFYKLQGLSWEQGTAIYYALMEPQFHVSPLCNLVISNAAVVTMATYGTLVYQSAFPWLILHPRLKWLAIFSGFMFHVAIAVLMGLWWFSAVLLSCETILLTDSQYREAAALATQMLKRVELFVSPRTSTRGKIA